MYKTLLVNILVFWNKRNVLIQLTSKLFKYCISMTTFWLVHRQTPSGKAEVLKATPINNTSEEEYYDERQNRRSRQNTTRAKHGGHQQTRYTSQIGLIYLKPVVHYSTSVYFHSNNYFQGEHRSAQGNRYGLAVVFPCKITWPIYLFCL